MNLKECRYLVLGLASGGLLLVGLLCLLIANPQIARADPGDLFVSPTGSGTACSQAVPCTLQTALSQATDGDTIYLAQGTYTGSGNNLLYIDKSIALYGGWNGAATGPVVRDPAAYPSTLDGENARRVVSIAANATPTLDGLRLTNGSAGDGGAIYANGAAPIVSGCHIFNNTALYSGGAVYLNNSPNARLTGNWIYGNTANTYYGGGIYIRNGANTVLANNTIHDNTANQGGGGVYLDSSDNSVLQANSIYANTSANAYGGGLFVGGSDNVRVVGNWVYDNHAASQGGGIYLNNSANAALTGNRVYDNVSDGSGGGISLHIYSDGATLASNTVYRNTAGSNGGGLYLYESANVTLINNMITENRLTDLGAGGAGIYLYDGSAHLLHTTIARNSGGSGQGIHLQQEATVWITNTILVSHTVGIEAGTGTTATLTATLWGSGVWANGADWGGEGTILTGTVNIWDDPAFVNPDAGDLHIGLASAAIDRGVMAGVSSDIDAEPRFGVPDLGADEYWAPGALKRVYLPLVVKGYP